jgi:hypothetical protein
MKYYVYALDIKSRCITAALSFQDENTAHQSYLIANREMDATDHKEFQFGTTSDSQVTNDFDVALGEAQALLRIDFTALPRDYYRKGKRPHKIFDINVFERAESLTEEILSNYRYSRQDIQFMRLVQSAKTKFDRDIADSPSITRTKRNNMDVLSLRNDDTEQNIEDITKILCRLKGRWVSQKDFLDQNINAQRNKFTIITLHHQREKGCVVWSKNKPMIGRDKGGRFLERIGNNPYTYLYRYFLLYENDKTSPSHVPNGK